MDEAIDIYSQEAAAYLLLSGVRLLRVNFTDTLATYKFDNRDGQAVECLKQWRRGSVQVPARDYVEAFRTILSITKKMSRPATAGEVNEYRSTIAG